MSATETTAARFPCTPGGAVARGRRRLRWLLGGTGGLMLAVAVVTAAVGRPWPAILAALTALAPWAALWLSVGVEPLWLELEGERLRVQLRGRAERIALAGAEARRLGREEIAHLHRLASTAGVAAAAGGFDSHLLGEFELFASDLDHAVLVAAPERTLVLTPDDPDAFLALLSQRRLARIQPP